MSLFRFTRTKELAILYSRGNFFERKMTKKSGGRDVKYNKNVYHALTTISQFGINMLVPIFLCAFLGLFLDRRLGTSCFMVILFFAGALAGFRNVYLLAKKIYDDGGSSPYGGRRKDKK